MKLDAHVHTRYSGRRSLCPLSLIMRESYNRPERVYQLAKARGIDLVAITGHDCIAGALTLVDHPDVLVGCEETAAFPRDGVRVHLNVLDITDHTMPGIGQICLVVRPSTRRPPSATRLLPDGVSA